MVAHIPSIARVQWPRSSIVQDWGGTTRESQGVVQKKIKLNSFKN